MPYFDPIRERHNVLTVDLEAELNSPVERYLPHGVGNAAVFSLTTIIYGWLCGLQNEVHPLLTKYMAWLEDAIKRKEQCGESPAYSSMRHLEAYSLCKWLAENASDKTIYRHAIRQHEIAWDEFDKLGGICDKEVRLSTLADYLKNCFQAGEFATALACYESLVGKRIHSFKEAMTDSEFAYWACGQRLNGTWSADEHAKFGARLLQKHLEYDWLGNGHALRAASWLKMVYWDSGLIRTPLATLLKAYDLMPHVTRPDFTIPAPKDNGGA
ncbi:MAG: hypothetical protein NTX45_13555 [Proteobacteria bacterium]|nr:hypothetical protein [Pseudomonadota bacterium]